MRLNNEGPISRMKLSPGSNASWRGEAVLQRLRSQRQYVQHLPNPPTNTDVLMLSTMPELRGRDYLGIFSKRFRTLDSEIIVNTSETPRVEHERLHGKKLLGELFLAWEVLTKGTKKQRGIWR